MYGLVNRAIEEMVVEGHGKAAWTEITVAAGLEGQDFLNSMSEYPDEITYRLVGAACRVLGAQPQDVLFAFGEYWVLHTAAGGYGDLFEMAGSEFAEFLENLDSLHLRVGLSFPELKPPSFEVEHLGEGHLNLHYRSGRAGLAPMVCGLLSGLAKKLQTEIEIEQIQAQSPDNELHDIFSIHYRRSAQ